jgi:hypothetical protein
LTSIEKTNGNTNKATEKTGDVPAQAKTIQIELPSALSVRQLSDALKVSSVEIIKRLMKTGIMANICRPGNRDQNQAAYS